jgi:hypothetical protein
MAATGAADDTMPSRNRGGSSGGPGAPPSSLGSRAGLDSLQLEKGFRRLRGFRMIWTEAFAQLSVR